MNFLFTDDGVRIGRDRGDKPIRKESTVVFRLLKALNAGETRGRWVRFYPDLHGLTACKLGVRNAVQGYIYWHEAYETESAHEAFNAGQVCFKRA